MATSIETPASWRGRSWSFWYKSASKKPILRKVIEMYSGHTAPFFERRDKLLLHLMKVLDEYQPPLSNAEALAAIQYQRRPPVLPIRDAINLAPTSPIFPLTPVTPIFTRDIDTLTDLVKISPIAREPKTLDDDLQNYVRSLVLDDNDEALQPAHGLTALLPPHSPNESKLMVDKEAFNVIFDDETDPKITALNVEFTQRQSVGTQSYQCSKHGKPLPYRGRGPIWLDNSSHVDCCITAARLTDLGSTKADLRGASKSDWLQNVSTMQRAFLSVVELPWETFRRGTNIRQRHHFLHLYYARRKELGKVGALGGLQAASDSWQICAEGFGQFQYSSYQRTTCDRCLHVFPDLPPKSLPKQTMLEIRALRLQGLKDEARLSMADRFRQHFSPRIGNCQRFGCEGPAWRTTIVRGELPHRLVVPTPALADDQLGGAPRPKDRSIPGSTADRIRVHYKNEQGERVANYRWIGGIYEYNRHFRLYWSDRKYGESGNLMVYDGMRCSGSIVGGLPPFSAQDKIPPAWSEGSDMLFYERIWPEGAHANGETVGKEKADSTVEEGLSGNRHSAPMKARRNPKGGDR